jgi:Ribbon-helix-helix protein, copG family
MGVIESYSPLAIRDYRRTTIIENIWAHRNLGDLDMRKVRKVETVALRMDESLVSAIDTLAERQFRSRSDIIRQGTLRELESNGLIPLAAVEG